MLVREENAASLPLSHRAERTRGKARGNSRQEIVISRSAPRALDKRRLRWWNSTRGQMICSSRVFRYRRAGQGEKGDIGDGNSTAAIIERTYSD